MSDNITLNPNPPAHPGMDYTRLRAEGLRYIQELAGTIWTDHNGHDPGITILEEVCYALTDLGYRLSFPLPDLLASGQANPYAGLFSPAELLTTRPVTFTDLRKVVLDVSGVKNGWVTPLQGADPPIFRDRVGRLTLQARYDRTPLTLRGLYKVEIELDEASNEAALPEKVMRTVTNRLHAHRNVGEDFVVGKPGEQRTRVVAKIAIHHTEDADALLARIWFRLSRAISPRVNFYTLPEIQALSVANEDIFEGPALEHGFIDSRELARMKRKSELRSSDLIAEIMQEAEVKVVQNLKLGDQSTLKDWVFELDPGRIPKLDLVDGTTIQLIRELEPVDIDLDRANRLYQEMQLREVPQPIAREAKDLLPPQGRDRNIESYQSILDQFPNTYGINELGLPEGAPEERQARARQLKGYLLFFDQVLANHFSQAAHMNQLLSFHTVDHKTYFSQPLAPIRREEGLIAYADQEAWAEGLETLNKPFDQEGTRRARFLHHLLARFGHNPEEIQPLAGATETSSTELKIEALKSMLRDFPSISRNRGGAFDYSQRAWDTTNISGLERRLMRMLGIRNPRRRNLVQEIESEVFVAEEGFHLLEHILLRPVKEDVKTAGPKVYPGVIFRLEAYRDPETEEDFTRCVSAGHGLTEGQWVKLMDEGGMLEERRVSRVSEDQFFVIPPLSFPPESLIKWEYKEPPVTEAYTFPFLDTTSPDPFSLEITFVMPGEAGRFQSEGFRETVYRTLEREVPAHLTWQVLWLTNVEMISFEAAWKDWLIALREVSHG